MAVFIDKHRQWHEITHEQALEIYKCMRGLKPATEAQKKWIAENVVDVHMNFMWHDDIPEQYYQEHLAYIRNMSMLNWTVNDKGALVEPPEAYTPYNERLWTLARKYGWLNPLSRY